MTVARLSHPLRVCSASCSAFKSTGFYLVACVARLFVYSTPQLKRLFLGGFMLWVSIRKHALQRATRNALQKQ